MSQLPDQPFLEGESRYFLAEILKTSDVPPAELVKMIRDRDIRPRWEQMALPNGRSIASCKQQYDMLTNRLSSIISTSGQLDIPRETFQVSAVQKRQGASANDVPALHQYQFAPINEPSNPSAFHPAPLVHTELADKSGKKRGRPSKAERELREAEARARGEVYQPTKRKPKTPRPSAEGTITGETEEESSSKKRSKKPKLSFEPMGPPLHPGSENPPFAAPHYPVAEQMQLDPTESHPRSTIPETQASSGFGASDSLIAAMQEQANRPQATPPTLDSQQPSTQLATAQSSVTLPHGSFQPDIPGEGHPPITTERTSHD